MGAIGGKPAEQIRGANIRNNKRTHQRARVQMPCQTAACMLPQSLGLWELIHVNATFHRQAAARGRVLAYRRAAGSRAAAACIVEAAAEAAGTAEAGSYRTAEAAAAEPLDQTEVQDRQAAAGPGAGGSCSESQIQINALAPPAKVCASPRAHASKATFTLIYRLRDRLRRRWHHPRRECPITRH